GLGPVPETAQGKRVARNAEAGDGAETGARHFGDVAAPGRIGDVDLDRREADVADGGDQRRVAARVSGRIDDRARHAFVVRRVEAVDHLAFDVGMEDLDLHRELVGIGPDYRIVLRQRHRPEDLDLRLAAHVHAGAMDYKDFHDRSFLVSV